MGSLPRHVQLQSGLSILENSAEKIWRSTFQITRVFVIRYPSNLSGLLKTVVHLRV